MRIIRFHSGFTLIEMLTAVAVLSLLMVMAVQVISTSSRVLQLSTRRLSATSAARFALDTIGRDLSRRVARPESPISIISNTGNDEIRFYSTVPSNSPSGSDARGIALVAYRVQPTTGLSRAALGTGWDRLGTPLSFINPTISQTLAAPSSDDFEDLSPLVFRMEIVVLDKTGQLLATAPTVPDTFRKNISAIIICIASLDAEGRKKIPNLSSSMISLTNEFTDARDGQIPANAWLAKLNSPQTLSQATGIPIDVLASIKIVQRTYALP